jgi:hypothetical protein
MIRRAAAVIVALTLNQALLHAQDIVFTVSVASADVHKGPSTVTPVIGHASRGAMLHVSRNLGSWVKVPWPEAPDGIGYVHVTMGRFGAPGTAMPAAASPRPTTVSNTSIGARPPAARTSIGEPIVPSGQRLRTTPASHVFGIGGLVAASSTVPNSFGATARAWGDNRLGIQVGVTRDAMTSDLAAGRVTSMQIEPGIVYGLFDRVTDYVWIRPYIGSVVSLRHQTLSLPTPGAPTPAADNGIGLRAFGGAELTFATLPRFGLSADVGYRRYPAPFPGFEVSPVNMSVAGHWYLK